MLDGFAWPGVHPSARGRRSTSVMTAPWERKSTKSSGKTTLTPESIAWARARAKAAGRRYPNLVDNMAAARRQAEAAPRPPGPAFLRKL